MKPGQLKESSALKNVFIRHTLQGSTAKPEGLQLLEDGGICKNWYAINPVLNGTNQRLTWAIPVGNF
jgi:hypothetical protein